MDCTMYSATQDKPSERAVFFCILGRLRRTHDKVVRPQAKGGLLDAGELCE